MRLICSAIQQVDTLMQNIGEEITGEYLKVCKGCDFIAYNLYTPDIQGEIDVVGINIKNRTVYVCEVAVHLGGLPMTPEEKRFLKKHKIHLDDVFDARYEPTSFWTEEAKRQGKNFIIKDPPCKEAGHRLYTRKNKCIQCNTEQIAYMLRVYESGFVYIAGSICEKFIKIGSAKNIKERKRTLPEQSYGGANDWKILRYVKVEHRGKTEGEIQNDLREYKYKKDAYYQKDGRKQQASELYQCSFTDAAIAFGMATIRKQPTNTIGSFFEYEFVYSNKIVPIPVTVSTRPESSAVINLIGKAKHTIRVAAYSFTSKDITKALMDAHKNGIDVQVLLDKSNVTARYSRASLIAGSGIPVRIDKKYSIMHDKFMVIDAEMTLQIGSSNDTKAVEEHNAENLFILHDKPDIADQHQNNWLKIWNKSEEWGKQTVQQPNKQHT